MRVAIYCRVSTDEQRERQSIQGQVEYAKRFCERARIEIVEFYLDDGVGGGLPFSERTQGARMLRDAESGEFDVVLVFMIDRFARDVWVGVSALRELEAAGVYLKSMSEGLDTSTPRGKKEAISLMNDAEAWKAQYVERSREMTEQLVGEGMWVGVCPFGYRVEGRGRHARIVPSEEPMEGLDVSEAEVVRLMYHLIANEKRSCYQVCDRLTEMKVPPAYARDGKEIKKGARKEATAGIWRPSRVRNLIVNTTYMGTHRWGKRPNNDKEREVIEREVPPLVDADTWRRAQAVLRENQLFSGANKKVDYLLRGLVKCGLCGLNFCGYSAKTSEGDTSYYRCNGRSQARGLYGKIGKICPSRTVRAAEVEARVWSDIEGYLRNPGDTLEQIAAKHHDVDGEADRLRAESERLAAAIKAKGAERARVISMCRKELITESDLEKQMAEIQREENDLKQEAREVDTRTRGLAESRDRLDSAETLLSDLGKRLDEGLSWEQRREIVETLVERVTVDSEPGREEVYIRPRYCFTETVNCMDTDSSLQPA